MSRFLVIFFGDALDFFIANEVGTVNVIFRMAERTVSNGHDAALLAEFREFLLVQFRAAFDLFARESNNKQYYYSRCVRTEYQQS